MLNRVYKPPKRRPFDDEYILGIVLQHKRHLVLATVTVLLCTASNLAAPVLSGMLFEHLVQQRPVEKYAQVRRGTALNGSCLDQPLFSQLTSCRATGQSSSQEVRRSWLGSISLSKQLGTSQQQQHPLTVEVSFTPRLTPLPPLLYPSLQYLTPTLPLPASPPARPRRVCVQVFSVLLFGYLLEPLLTRVYMVNVIAAGEKVLATLRMELFRTLLMQKIEFFDRHSATALQSLISVELDTVRTFIFK